MKVDFVREAKYDFVRNKIDMRKLLKKLDISFTDNNNELWSCCPYHDERTPSWSINNDKTSDRFGQFNCFGCGWKGDWIKLISFVKECDTQEAIEFAKALFGIGTIDEKLLYDFSIDERRSLNDTYEQLFEFKPIKLPPEFKRVYKGDVLAERFYQYLENRGLTEYVIVKNKIMYCRGTPKKKEHRRYKDRVIIPIFKDDMIVSFFARSILKNCPSKKRGLYPPESPIGKIMYGMDSLDYKLNYCIVCEGPFDKLRLESLGYKNVLASLGNRLNKHKIDIIKPFKQIWVIPDADSGGEILEEYFKMLKYTNNVFVNDLPDYEDPGSADPDDIRMGFKRRRKITEAIKKYKIVVDYDLSDRK